LGCECEVAEGDGEARAVQGGFEDAGIDYCGFDVPFGFFYILVDEHG